MGKTQSLLQMAEAQPDAHAEAGRKEQAGIDHEAQITQMLGLQAQQPPQRGQRLDIQAQGCAMPFHADGPRWSCRSGYPLRCSTEAIAVPAQPSLYGYG